MDTRKNILDTASRLFYQQGYNSTGINQIIDEAGVAKATLYQHFNSKEDLLVAYLEIASDQTRSQLRHIASMQSGPKEKISAIFEYLSENADAEGFCGCNFLNIAGEIPVENVRIYDIIKQQKNETRAFFTEILQADVMGEAEMQRTKTLADGLYLLFDGALMACKVFSSSWPAAEAHKTALALV